MEAEIIDLARLSYILFPIINITQYLWKTVGLLVGFTLMKLSVHEDNVRALILARTFPQNFTLCSKYYATKIIWFCEEINKRNIVLFKIAKFEKLGYLFTKGLPRATFESLWNKLMGW